MLRTVASLIILCLVAANIDAATHIGTFLSDPPATEHAHEAHGFHTAPDGSAPAGNAHHFCHCGAHSPAFSSAIAIVMPHLGAAAEDDPPAPLLGALRLPPPLRPPNAV